jgi:hypothetical protein
MFSFGLSAFASICSFNMSKTIYLLNIILFFICPAFGQSIHISGIVVDEHNNPFSYANVSLKHTMVGTFTNNDGKFVLSAPQRSDTIIVSFVGYANSMQKLVTNKQAYRFEMKPVAVGLDEVVVSNLTPASLLKKAIAKIPENYPQESVLLKAFYRTKITKNNTLVYAQEAAFNILKTYKRNTDDILFVDKTRNFYLGKGMSNRILAGLGTIDILKSGELSSSSFFRKHNIRYLPATIYDNHQVYVLHVVSKKDSIGGVEGKIYIDTNDLGFVRFDFIYQNTGKHTVCQYQKVNGKYMLSMQNIENGILSNGLGIPEPNYKTDSQWVVTDIVDNCNKDSIPGVVYQDMSALSGYPNNESDTTFWKGYNRILPDSKLEEQIKIYRTDAQGHNITTQPKKNIRLLYPEFSLWVSIQTPNNLSTLTKNIVSTDMLAEHIANKLFHKNLLEKFLFSYAYNGLLSTPFLSVEAERELLSTKGLHVSYNPTLFSPYGRSYSYGLDNIEMSNLRNSDFPTYMRLHTIQNDVHYTAAKLIEEKLARVDLSNINNKFNYVFLYGVELLSHRESNVFWGLGSEPQTSNFSENKQPLIIDPQKSWIKYLFEPGFGYKRQVTADDLSANETRYLRRSSLFSLLNFISPQMLGSGKIKLSDNNRFTFSLNYLRTVFGEMFEQNIWLMHNSTLSGIFLRQYVNHEKAGIGLGYKWYDTPLANNLYLTSNLNYWCQPSECSFYDRSFSNGFSINQQLEWQFAKDKYIKRNNMSLFLGYNYKSKGYEPENFHLKANFDVQLGIKMRLK